MAARSFTVEGVYRDLALDFSARRAAERALSKRRRTSRYSERSEPSLRDEANPCAGRSGLVAFVRSRMRAARAVGRWLGGVRRGGSCRPRVACRTPRGVGRACRCGSPGGSLRRGCVISTVARRSPWPERVLPPVWVPRVSERRPSDRVRCVRRCRSRGRWRWVRHRWSRDRCGGALRRRPPRHGRCRCR